MTERPQDPGDKARDAAFDARLAALLDTAIAAPDTDLSAAVLTRLAASPGAAPRRSWLAPLPLATGASGLLAAGVVAGYVGLPVLGPSPEDLTLMAAFGGIVTGEF